MDARINNRFEPCIVRILWMWPKVPIRTEAGKFSNLGVENLASAINDEGYVPLDPIFLNRVVIRSGQFRFTLESSKPKATARKFGGRIFREQ